MSDYKLNTSSKTTIKLSDSFPKIIIAKSLTVAAIAAMFLSAPAQAKDLDVGYYTFGQYRYFGPKLDVEDVGDGIEDNLTSGKRFYNNISKHQYNFYKNTGRNFKDAMGYGDWDKPYRIMSGFEYNFRQNKTSNSSYGYNDKSGTFFLMADKAFASNYWRLGGGLALNQYHSDYDNGIKAKQENYMALLHAIYNDKPNDMRLRSRLTFGYGNADLTRLAEENGSIEILKADYNSWYYGLENTFSKNFNFNNFYLQSYWELNGRGIRRDDISESQSTSAALSTKNRSSFLVDGLVGLYAGYKGEDGFGNRYNIKVGPDFSYIFSDPYNAFYLTDGIGNDLNMKKRPDYRDYVTWKAYFNYYFDNGLGLYSDFRYYVKDKDSISFALGVNYVF